LRPDPPELASVPLAALSPGARASIIRLCTDALASDCSSLFGYLSDSTHVLATLDGRLVGHACWTTRRLVPADLPPLRTSWVDAVVVDPAHQNIGVGTSVMRRLAELTEDFDLRALGTEQIAFFARLGWERWRGPTRGVLHDPLDSLMILGTATSPRMNTALPISSAE
jgi:aminoglycoside 2'-N-acetyltransferase I